MPAHFFVEAGLVSPTELKRALAAQASRGGTLGQNLVRLGLADEHALADTLAGHLALPLLDRADLVDIPEEVLRLLTPEVAAEHRAIPVRLDQDQLLVAMADPTDEQALEEVTFFAGTFVQRAVARESLVDWALAAYYGWYPAQPTEPPAPASGDLERLFAPRREPSQVFLLSRQKSRSRSARRGASRSAASGARCGEHDEHSARPPRRTDPRRVVIAAPPDGATCDDDMSALGLEGAPTIRMSCPLPTERSQGSPAPLLAKEDRSTDEMPAARRALLGDADALAREAQQGDAAVNTERPSEHAPAASPRRASITAEWEVRPTDIHQAVTRSVAHEEEGGEGRSGRVTLGRTGCHEPAPIARDRKRRHTMRGMAPSEESVGDRTERHVGRQSPADPSVEMERVVERLRVAETHDDVAGLALGFLGLLCARRALIRVDEGGLAGLAAAGDKIKLEAFRTMWIPLEWSSVFGAVIQSMIPYRGPLLFGREERIFASFVGKHPEEMLLVPVVVDDEVIALVYGDGLSPALPLGLVQALAREIGTAMTRVGGRETR